MRVYLDNCCLNRPFDDQRQDRIRLESEAVLSVMGRFQTGEWFWIGSDILYYEIVNTQDVERREALTLSAAAIHENVEISALPAARSRELEALGFRAIDALHIAAAETGRCDVLLTTDDKMLSVAKRHARQLQVRVESPTVWLAEVLQ